MAQVVYENLYEYPVKEFANHLNKGGNDKILFSGKYGIGKTSFLQNYFLQEQLRSKYNVYHLFPVNYSIASNEDIMRYLKYDLVLQLLEKNTEINEAASSYLKTLPAFFRKNLDKVAAAFVYMIPKLGKDVVDAYEKWKPLIQEFLALHDQLNPIKGDQLVDYLDKIEVMDGGLFESDIITNIIIETIRQGEGRQSVLIVDDLDRLDPEHVFRIMNVFAAHLDNPKSIKSKSESNKILLKNKFGFDKVILVCDFLNIERLFYHKYGQEIDFSGYADKFYSSDVFHFDNKLAINSIIRNCLSNGIKEDTVDDNEFSHYYEFLVRNAFLESIFQFLISNSMINLRNVLKLQYVNIPKNRIKLGNGIVYEVDQFPIIPQLKILKDVFGDIRRLLFVIDRCKNLKSPFQNIDYSFADFLFIIKSHESHFRIKDKMDTLAFNGKLLAIEVNDRQYRINVQVFETIDVDGSSVDKGNVYKATANDFWIAFYKAIDVLNELGYLQ